MSIRITPKFLKVLDDRICEIQHINSDRDVETRTDYMGRGWHSDTCVGWVIDGESLVIVIAMLDLVEEHVVEDFPNDEIFLALKEESLVENYENIFQYFKTDTMGRSMIHYLPNVRVHDEDQDDEVPC